MGGPHYQRSRPAQAARPAVNVCEARSRATLRDLKSDQALLGARHGERTGASGTPSARTGNALPEAAGALGAAPQRRRQAIGERCGRSDRSGYPRRWCHGMSGTRRDALDLWAAHPRAAGRRQRQQRGAIQDRIGRGTTASSNTRAQRLRSAQLKGPRVSAERRSEANDFHMIRNMMPRNLPPEVCDDAVQSIFLALLEGSLQ